MRNLFFIFAFQLIYSCKLFSQDIGSIGQTQPFTVHGSIGGNMTSYSADKIPDRQKSFTWLLNGNLNASVYGINIPVSFTITEQQRSYTQPFNQFGMSPYYKWATFHLGYRSMQFSPFTLSGNTFLGAGVELKPKNIRFAAMTGRFQKAVEEDTLNFSSPAFKRTGYAVKAGYGSENDFIDLIYLKAKDDTTSLSFKPKKSELIPSDNTVTGVSVKKSFLKKIFFDLDFATSKFISNLYFDSSEIKRNAIRTSAVYQFTNTTMKVQFKRIEPDYKSLGAAFFTADVQEITFQPSFVVMQKKLRLLASIGTQHDNLKKQKFATTNRLISSATANYMPNTKYGLDVNYMNYATDQENGRIPLVDSVKLSQTLNNFTITNRYTLMGTSNIQNFIFTINYQKLNDLNKFTEQFTENKTQVYNLTYVFTTLKKPLSVTATLMHSETTVAANNSQNNGITIGSSESFKNGMFSMNSTLSYIINSLNSQSNSKILNFIFGANYRPHKQHALNVNFNFLGNTATSSSNISYSEKRFTFGYNYTF